MRALALCLLLSACHLLDPEPEPEPVTHTVQRGDTLWKISKAHGVPIDAIKVANGLTSDTIEIDQVLTIPTDGAPATATARTSTPRKPARTGRSSGGGRVAPAAGGGGGGLSLPPEKKCLAGPSDVGSAGDEAEMVSSAGLSHGQVKASMDAFLGKLGRCVDGGWPTGEATVEVTVACTGRVSGVSVSDRGTLDAELLGCIKETLRYAEFPAHDLPDGETFAYPLRFSAP